MAEKLTPRDVDYNDWYNTLVLKADLADYGPVRGTMIVKPYGWALWENIQQALDTRFKATGHMNAGFPMFIPLSYMEKEASHVKGFSPQLAIVTHGGGKKLEEPLVVRPTSETLIGHAFAKWIESYRDLPVLLNLWNSVVRWEMRTKLFLRTTEFYWQEGHTAHATAEEADFETRQMLDVYTDFAMNDAAIPVIPGEKSAIERFAGANQTFSIEAMMGDGKALQAGTSHNLGQNFAKAFDIIFQDEQNELQHVWTTSWGISTRFLGGIIMVHGDDQGLVLPPKLAPYQAVIVPIFNNQVDKVAVIDAVDAVRQQLVEGEIRVKVDARENLSPGFKFNDWELRGVPVRIEIGPRDVTNNTMVLARRDMLGKAGKSFVPMDNAAVSVQALLDDVQKAMFDKALKFRENNTKAVSTYDDFKDVVQTGFAKVWWAGTDDDERKVQEETKATLRIFPIDQPVGEGVCFYTGKPTSQMAIFSKAY